MVTISEVPEVTLSFQGKIIPGITGPAGPKGDKGDTGPIGPKGNTGDIGPQGERGEEGKSFSPNVIAPIASKTEYDEESPGFSFLASDEGMIYFRLDPTGWSEGMAFGKGEKGDKGDTGDTGNTGPAGAKGDKGDKGDTGATGATGAAGKGVSSSAVAYQAATSGTVAPTGTWSASPPTVAKGQYLWTRAVITYTDATTSTLYSVAYQGQDGTGGSTGGGLPAGGTAGQVLTKQSATNGDADWKDPSGGGGGDSAFKRAMAPSNVVIQSLNPVTIVSVALDGASAYHIQFKGTLNDNASSAGLKVCVGSIDKREMALRVSYRDSTGALITKKILEGGVDNGVTFSGSEANGPGNLLTIDGYILTGNTNATTPFVVQLCNADAQWDYRQMTQGASISAEKMGTIALS